MQNNVLKPMDFNNVRVRVFWKTIEKTKKISPKNSLEKAMNKT